MDKVVLIPCRRPTPVPRRWLSKQVDWIEAPAPDAIDQIKSQGFHPLRQHPAASVAPAVLL
ncbi:hypothetical protein LN650_23965 [Klebsiella pneumoniae subsp. pneumoniae]|nr:hypothetical protein [Klebsiella pneumoniae subsp. pneumoniae]